MWKTPIHKSGHIYAPSSLCIGDGQGAEGCHPIKMKPVYIYIYIEDWYTHIYYTDLFQSPSRCFENLLKCICNTFIVLYVVWYFM